MTFRKAGIECAFYSTLISLENPERLWSRATEAIERAVIVEVSALSISEIAIKNSAGKIDMALSQITKGMDDLVARFPTAHFENTGASP